ncbi:Metallo-dependent phosphatase [Stereum hirsutum FP-91666 SS1]|uniref:Metallo-dependent phosphatase n=1 Tax=Stereum hirsutum (strain FP-91666) TaxID=721885 RepID=UPI000444A09C|nr:Metallo-dependent phosphatase [Stereum hirsutum FP-91666 SS1]EIM83023.1 Metallo-dependent phosphatase [Stereum hirsutum FP-91666 SS1]
MIPVLNHLGIDIACYGNHDFDFGEARLKELSEECNFPWVLSNAYSPSGGLLASANKYLVREHKGDWPSNCQHLPRGTAIVDPVQTAQEVAHILREREGADLVVAITHMRLEEDIKVSEACRSSVDLILGGHDHDIVVHGANIMVVNDDAEGDIRIVKSGTDFRTYSIVRLEIDRGSDRCRVRKVRVHHERDPLRARDHSEDEGINDILCTVQERIASISDARLFYTATPLDGRSAHNHSMLADAVRAYYDTDIAFVNSGSIRCNRVIPEGVCTVRDVIDIVPFDNAFVVKRLPNAALITALENSVSDARTDGRFLQLSGMSLLVDLRQPNGNRVLRATLDSGQELIEGSMNGPKAYHTVAMVDFLGQGFDGYVGLAVAETLVDAEGAMTDTALIMSVLRGENDPEAERMEDDTEDKLKRARVAIVVGFREGLPVVKPESENRIIFTS